jgi:hypothetical protein
LTKPHLSPKLETNPGGADVNILNLKANCLIQPALPYTQPSPVIKRGLGFEAKVGDWLADWAAALGFRLIDHPWLQSADGSWNQPDYIWVSPSRSAVLFEVKLTWTTETPCQLARYSALLGDYHPVTEVVICRNVTPLTPNIIHHPSQIYHQSTLHLPMTLPPP